MSTMKPRFDELMKLDSDSRRFIDGVDPYTLKERSFSEMLIFSVASLSLDVRTLHKNSLCFFLVFTVVIII